MVLNQGGRRYYPATRQADGLLSAEDYTLLHSMQVPIFRLSYGPATNHLNGAALTANTYADIHANQNFTVAGGGSILLVNIRLSVVASSTVAVLSLATRAVIDSAGTPVNVVLGGGISEINNFANAGGGSFILSGLAAGTHTIKTQVIAGQNATAYCRASSLPNFEFLAIHITEFNP